jgi:DnaJ-class molecular chaperone
MQKKKFKEISSAYDVLSDNDKKSNYDRFGSTDGKSSGNPFGGGQGFGFNMDDIFSQFGYFLEAVSNLESTKEGKEELKYKTIIKYRRNYNWLC